MTTIPKLHIQQLASGKEEGKKPLHLLILGEPTRCSSHRPNPQPKLDPSVPFPSLDLFVRRPTAQQRCILLCAPLRTRPSRHCNVFSCNGASDVGGGREVKRGKERECGWGVDWVFSALLGRVSYRRLPNQSDLRCRTGKIYARSRNRNSFAPQRGCDSYHTSTSTRAQVPVHYGSVQSCTGSIWVSGSLAGKEKIFVVSYYSWTGMSQAELTSSVQGHSRRDYPLSSLVT